VGETRRSPWKRQNPEKKFLMPLGGKETRAQKSRRRVDEIRVMETHYRDQEKASQGKARTGERKYVPTESERGKRRTSMDITGGGGIDMATEKSSGDWRESY